MEPSIEKRRGRPPKMVPDTTSARDHVLDCCADALERAAAMRAGNMDSDSRHLAVVEEIRSIVLDVAQQLRNLND